MFSEKVAIDEVGAMLQRIGYSFLGTKSISSLIVQGIGNVIGLIKFWLVFIIFRMIT